MPKISCGSAFEGCLVCVLIRARWHLETATQLPGPPRPHQSLRHRHAHIFSCYCYCCDCCYTLFLPRGKVRPADKLQLKAATIVPFVGLARCKQDPINRGHGAQYLCRRGHLLLSCQILQRFHQPLDASAAVLCANNTH